MKLLAIDPGYERIGIAIIERLPKPVSPNQGGQKDVLVYSSCFKTKIIFSFPERLLAIGSEVERVIKEYRPTALAIEKIYFTTNQKTAMGVAEARGAIIYTAVKNRLSIFEYSPPQIKVAVTGYGKASKIMVMSMIPKLIQGADKISSDDELDAIAIGLTCMAIEKNLTLI